VSDPSSNVSADAASTPIYADKSSGERYDSAIAMIDAYLARFAARASLKDEAGAAVLPKLDESGYAQVQRGSATIGVNVLDEQGVLMVFSPVMTIPVTGREAFYRRLLELSFVTTSDAAFAINAPQDEVVVRCLRRLSALDYEEFEDIVATVGEVADRWDEQLVRQFGT
jgi:hypothetical protein